MTLSTTDSRFTYSGDAVTVAFAFPRKYIASADLKVVVTDEDDGSESVKTLNVDYTITGAGLSNGVYASATITFVTAPGTDKKVIIYRDPALTQEFDFQSETDPLAALNRRCDLLMMEIQRLQDQVSRSMRKSEGFWSTLDMTLPDIDGTDAAVGYVPMIATGLATMTWGAVASVSGITIASAWATVIQSASLALGLSAAGLGTEDSPTFTGLTLTGVLSASDGAVGAPSITNTGDTNTGFYFGAADQIDAATGGVNRWSLTTTTFTTSVLIRATGGAVDFPTYSFSDDTDCGWYRIGANNIGFSLNGVKYLDCATTAFIFTTAILSNSPTLGIGYSAGAGGTVTQGTSRTTAVALNNVSGAITLFSAAGSATPASFTVTNSAVAATDVIELNQKSGTDKYVLLVTAVAAGSFQITFYTTGGTTTEQPVINFAVIKAVAA